MTGRRLALIVTADSYTDETLTDLRAAGADVPALAAVLRDPARGGFAVQMLRNATSSATAEAVDEFLDSCLPSDFVVLYFSGHALPDRTGELYLAATNTNPRRLPSTAIEAAWIARLMWRSLARGIVLFLDCCYSAGAEIDVLDQFVRGRPAPDRGRAIITAAPSRSARRPSSFTTALVEGIRTGAADHDRDGQISLVDLYNDISMRTPSRPPQQWELGLPGDFYLARCPVVPIVPAPLPPALLELIANAEPADRMRAVTELAALAAGAEVALAAAARLALADMSNDDSQPVRAEVNQALALTTLRISPTVIDAGAAIVGDQPFRVKVGVEGPPLALASTITTSSDTLTARLAGAVLQVQWRPVAAQQFDGVITVAGAAGECVLRFSGTALPAGGTREQVKAMVRTHPPESLLCCGICGYGVKARNLIRHLDRVHIGRYERWPTPTPEPAPQATPPVPAPYSPVPEPSLGPDLQAAPPPGIWRRLRRLFGSGGETRSTQRHSPAAGVQRAAPRRLTQAAAVERMAPKRSTKAAAVEPAVPKRSTQAAEVERQTLSQHLRTLDPGVVLVCERCGAPVKVKNMLRHQDRQHG